MYTHSNASKSNNTILPPFRSDELDDKKWMNEYKETDPSELAKTAKDLLAGVDDPKLTNSEVSFK